VYNAWYRKAIARVYYGPINYGYLGIWKFTMIEKSKDLINLVAGLIGIAFDRVQTEPNGEVASEPDASGADNLTQINGIGPAFASRLNEAGITTFAKLANLSPEEVREAAKITGGQADPAVWIAEAETLA
jgi:hypothetical protein